MTRTEVFEALKRASCRCGHWPDCCHARAEDNAYRSWTTEHVLRALEILGEPITTLTSALTFNETAAPLTVDPEPTSSVEGHPHVEYVRLPWRVGRRIGRTIYVDIGDPDPNDGSLLIGVMDTPELATRAVDAHNERVAVEAAIRDHEQRKRENRPYENAVSMEEFARMILQRGYAKVYSCDCGRVTATGPIGRQPCCGPLDNDGSSDAF